MKPQLIITGKQLNQETVMGVTSCLESKQEVFARDWYSKVTGEVGYTGNALMELTPKLLSKELKLLADAVDPDLEIGVTMMSGIAGAYTAPVVSYKVKNKKVTVDLFCHLGHPAPKRVC